MHCAMVLFWFHAHRKEDGLSILKRGALDLGLRRVPTHYRGGGGGGGGLLTQLLLPSPKLTKSQSKVDVGGGGRAGCDGFVPKFKTDKISKPHVEVGGGGRPNLCS